MDLLDENGNLIRRVDSTGVTEWDAEGNLIRFVSSADATGLDAQAIINSTEWHTWVDALQTQNSAVESCRSQMQTITQAIINWNQDASAYMFGPRGADGKPLYGKVDIPTAITLMQQAETAIVTYKTFSDKPEDLRSQYEWLIGRSSQASVLIGLSSLIN